MRIPSDDCAAGALSWFDAARFCNWLSQHEGIPEDQWCFPKEIGPGMVLPADALERSGYRLPTEAEWEYLCRAGATTIWPFGLSGSRLEDYAWTLDDAGRVMHPPGLKPPNDAGMFDLLGNASEWCIGLVDLNRDANLFRTGKDSLLFTGTAEGIGIDSRGGSFLDPRRTSARPTGTSADCSSGCRPSASAWRTPAHGDAPLADVLIRVGASTRICDPLRALRTPADSARRPRSGGWRAVPRDGIRRFRPGSRRVASDSRGSTVHSSRGSPITWRLRFPRSGGCPARASWQTEWRIRPDGLPTIGLPGDEQP